MKGLETGKDKIQKICDALRKETLEPAQQESREIIENAHLQASEILENAKERARKIIREAEKEIDEKKKVFQSSLQLACRQGIELLKEKIEEELFDHELFELVEKEMADPKTVAHILNAFLQMIQDKGIEDDFVAIIPKSITPRQISSLLLGQIAHRLKEKEMTIGDFSGGVQLRLKGRQISIDITDRVVRELIALYIRRDFRDLIFNV